MEDKEYYEEGFRKAQNGFIFLHLQGGPYQIGFQHGYLLRQEIGILLERMKKLAYQTTGIEWKTFVKEAKAQYKEKIENEYIEEMQGIADGASMGKCKVTLEEILAWNGYEELRDYYFPYASKKEPSRCTRYGKCSAFIANGSMTEDGKIILAHNTWESFLTGQYLYVIMDLVPASGKRILMQTAPGYISSFSDFFVNSAGIMAADTSIAGFTVYREEGTPQFFRIRKAGQYAESIAEFASILERETNGGYTSAWLIGDCNTNEIAKFELGVSYSSLVKSDDGFYIGCNVAEDPKIRFKECTENGYDDIRQHTGARRVRLMQLMKDYTGHLNVGNAKSIIGDCYDVYTGKPQPSSRTIDGHYELDPQIYSGFEGAKPFEPVGSLDGKVINSHMAKEMCFEARWGNSRGIPFLVQEYTARNPQWSHLKMYLEDRPRQPWSRFQVADE